jgi:hypothetical protein
MMDNNEAEDILKRLDKGIFTLISVRSRLATIIKQNQIVATTTSENQSIDSDGIEKNESKKPDVNKPER